MPGFNPTPHPAIVSRSGGDPKSPNQYLQLSDDGAARWTPDPDAAKVFESMREALRAATRLPSALRAYGLPHHAELMVGAELH